MSKCVVEHRGLGSDGESDDEDDDDDTDASSASDDAPVRILLFAFMFMFQGYGCMVGNPQHALKMKLDPGGTWGEQESKDFQDATASFQLAKLFMRIGQIAFLVFLRPNGIVFLSYIVMFVALLTPLIGVWGMGIDSLWIVYLQYSLGGAAVGMFEGTFLTAISSLGKDTKTFTIMGAPLGFAVNNVILGLLSQCGMPAQLYYVYNAACVPIAAAIFYHYAPRADGKSDGKGCQVFANSMRHARAWLPMMIPWLVAKFIGNFVLEDGFPLLFNTFNTSQVPMWGGPDSTRTISFALYASLYWFPMMALGDTISRRVPNWISIDSGSQIFLCLASSVVMCVGGEALDFLLIPIVTGIAAFISNFGNGFIYGLSAKFIDLYVSEEHRYAAYNLWCFAGDLGGYAGQSSFSVTLAHEACEGHHYEYVCHLQKATAPSSR